MIGACGVMAMSIRAVASTKDLISDLRLREISAVTSREQGFSQKNPRAQLAKLLLQLAAAVRHRPHCHRWPDARRARQCVVRS
jgi:hypothetical protein